MDDNNNNRSIVPIPVKKDTSTTRVDPRIYAINYNAIRVWMKAFHEHRAKDPEASNTDILDKMFPDNDFEDLD